ncbi:hypothetical protein HK097_001901 [Rhizophlyctis rosea]|uniref:J domain-containing protein n=1 Tax=Rhizophlyctis rosea TaxID=64517 RepID=A0AAD5S5G8_9FUNG|nr:hypothetical protein HK097_001901 [Rhizophlyctis rosea]
MDPYEEEREARNVEQMDEFDQAEELVSREQTVGALDCYAVLNVERNCSDEDLKNAYRRLCLTFHPDKHHQPEDKEAAERKFEVIQKAYDVLSDPTKRHIYDTYGAEGLQTSWEVGQRLRTPEEIREEFERQRQRRKEMDLENMVKTKGAIHLTLDATSIVAPDERVRRFGRPRVQPSGNFLQRLTIPPIVSALVKHSWDTSLSEKTDLSLQGTVTARNGLGVGNVTATVRHVHTPMLWGEVQGTLGQNPMVAGKIVKNFTPEIFGTVSAYTNTISSPPPLVLMLGRRLTPHTTGFITYKTGDYEFGSWGEIDGFREASSCSLGFARGTQGSQWNGDVSTGIQGSSVQLSYLRTLPKGVKGRMSVVLSTGMGVQVTVAGERRVTEHSRLEIGVSCAANGGTTLRLRLTRLGQKFVVPVILSPQMDLKLAALALILPLGTAFTVDRLLLGPRRKRELAEKLAHIREENAEALAQRKREAEEAIRLMRDSLTRKIESEKRNGLIIEEALYGKLPASKFQKPSAFSVDSFRTLFESSPSLSNLPDAPPGPDGPEGEKQYADVTLAVQALVNNGQMRISGGHSKANIIGFYDPCFGEAKRLRVRYRFNGRLHEVEVDDRAAVAAPVRGMLFPYLF